MKYTCANFMNRIDRLFAILLLLQRRKLVRAEDLARTFEISVRTVYRDMAALSEVGVPLVTLPARGYQLMEGYYLPPLVFSPAEASALFLGARMLALQAAGQLPHDAETALDKLAHALPDSSRQQVEELTRLIQFVVPQERFNLDDPRLKKLQQAIREQHVIHIRYHSYSRDEMTSRNVEPLELSYSNGSWYVSGYCRLRQGIRGFRLERIETLELLPETFTAHIPEDTVAPVVMVRIRFDANVLRWVRERQHYGLASEEAVADSADCIMVYRLHTTQELKSWLLGWGAAAEVLSPPAFRDEMRTEAQKLVERLT
jgi:predicted DNA-binding transcriptional regulator YafY